MPDLQNNHISIATAADIDALEILVNSAYRGESSTKGWTTEASILDGIRTNKSSLQKQIDNPAAVMLKYTNDEAELIGCVYLEKKKDKMYLGMLTVSPLLQAKGTGRQMMAAAERYALLQHCNTMTMTVISVRSELIAWYERNGYHDTGETQPFPTDPEFGIPRQDLKFIVMEKRLA